MHLRRRFDLLDAVLVEQMLDDVGEKSFDPVS
jgi:hypothetical protein